MDLVAALLWCLLVAWIAKLAQGRGRNPVGWAAGAAIAGALGYLVGHSLSARVVAGADAANTLWVVVGLLPLVMMIAAMVALGLVLQREPIKVSRSAIWPVHFMDRGPGRIVFDRAGARFEWSEGQRSELARLRHVAADGECVRIECSLGAEAVELAVLPMGKPATPAGRRQQSLALAARLRAV